MKFKMTENQTDFESLPYEDKLLSVLKNFCFTSYDPYVVPVLPLKEDTRYFNSIFVHGCLYRQICFILSKQLSLEEYFEIFETLDKRIQDENVIYSYNDRDLVRIEDYFEGDRLGQYVYPLFGPCIRADIDSAKSKK